MITLKYVATLIVLILFWVSAWRLYKDDNVLRDDSTAAVKPYSLARVQLWWWTIVILSLFAGTYGFGGNLWQFNDTCLALLGISLGTTTLGRIIDNQQVQDKTLTRHQNIPSQGFFIDILSDEHGMSVHRFQTVTLNLMYSGAFVMESLSTGAFAIFDAQTLGLLGISASAYLTLKAVEGKGNPPATGTVV